MPPRARRGFVPLSVCALIALLVAPATSRAGFEFQLAWGGTSAAQCSTPPGPEQGKFNKPSSVAYNNGNVYVVDQANNRVQRFDSGGTFLNMWGRNNGQCGENGGGNGEFNTPYGAATDAEGNLYVADFDNNRVQKFSAGGTFIKSWGSAGSGPGKFDLPQGVGVDKVNDYVYVADRVNGRVQKFDLDGNFIDMFSLPGSAQPTSVAVDSSGNLYVVDIGSGQVKKFNPSFTQIAQWDGSSSGTVFGNQLFNVAVDERDHIFVADVNNDRVAEFTDTGSFVTVIDDPLHPLSQPTSVAPDTLSGVYITDWGTDRIQKFVNPAGAGTTDNQAGASNTTLTFTAGDGVANDLTITLSAGTYTLVDVAPIAPTGTCSQGSDAYTVTCPGGSVTDINVQLKDRDDKVAVSAATPTTIDGGTGDDVLEGGSGSDSIDGGAGENIVSFANASSGVTSTLTSASGAGSDSLSNIDGIYGSANADDLTGDSSSNVIRGGAGDDTLDGAGGAGDTLDYGNAGSAVTVDLSSSTQNTGGAGTDTISGFENVTGSSHDDNLTGDSGNNTLIGGLGNDHLVGGGGTDRASYATSGLAVSVDLSDSTPQDTGGAGTDELDAIDDLTGSPRADTLKGDSNANDINGGLGSDVLEGGAGNDTIEGGNGVDRVSYSTAGSAVTVSLTTTPQDTVGAGTDTLTGVENLTGSAYNDTLTGNTGANAIDGSTGDDTISGGDGNDSLTGGGGTDTASYASASSGVTVSLADTGLQTTGGGGIDSVLEIENLIGSPQDDVIHGSDLINNVASGAGNDQIDVRDSTADTVDCGSGTDSATADNSDSLAQCETVSLPGDGGGTGGGGSTPAPVAPPAAVAPDVTPPSLGSLKADKISAKLGGSFTYVLNEFATVEFKLEKTQLGRKTKSKRRRGRHGKRRKRGKKGKSKCKRQTRRNRKGKVCRYYKNMGTFKQFGAPGANAYSFNGKVNGKSIKLGLYRLTAVATDLSGNKGEPVTISFPARR